MNLEERIADLREKLKHGTMRPWIITDSSGELTIACEDSSEVFAINGREHDAALVVAAINGLPSLLDDIDTLRVGHDLAVERRDRAISDGEALVLRVEDLRARADQVEATQGDIARTLEKITSIVERVADRPCETFAHGKDCEGHDRHSWCVPCLARHALRKISQ